MSKKVSKKCPKTIVDDNFCVSTRHPLYCFLVAAEEKQQPTFGLFSFRRGHCSRAQNAKTTSRPRESALASRYTELLAESALALSRRRDRSSHSRSTRAPRMFITKSDSSRSSACTVDVHAASSEDVVKREDPRSNGRSDIVYHDVKGDGCYPANSKVRVRPRRSRRLFVTRYPAPKRKATTSRIFLIFRARRKATDGASHPPPPRSR